jgi:hypothetical protein
LSLALGQKDEAADGKGSHPDESHEVPSYYTLLPFIGPPVSDIAGVFTRFALNPACGPVGGCIGRAN